ncbi:MAG TPA: hypothetical protein VJ672_12210 [Gemmatimonadaceae bacterium]|nr:hypothetical protein [Gemmatimonadaceae bacterium]
MLVTRVLLIGMALLSTFGVAQAQDGDDPRASGCYRFAFGTWTPPLDWLTAGHDSSTRDYVRQARPSGTTHGGAVANGNRESAMVDTAGSEQRLVLIPSWWPAGVSLRFPSFAAPGDTVRGTATAFVADGRAVAPTAQVAVWRVPCAGERPAP